MASKGLKDKAEDALKNRKSRIDSAIEKASGGSKKKATPAKKSKKAAPAKKTPAKGSDSKLAKSAKKVRVLASIGASKGASKETKAKANVKRKVAEKVSNKEFNKKLDKKLPKRRSN